MLLAEVAEFLLGYSVAELTVVGEVLQRTRGAVTTAGRHEGDTTLTDRATRALAAICGITGVLMLTAHFLIPANVPPDSAGLARIASFTRDHREVLLISAWLQVTGAILYVTFILAIVDLAGAGQRFAGRIVALAATILVGLTLLDSAMIIAAVESAAHGHNETLRVSFDLIAGPGNDGIGRSFLIAPAILLPLGFVILQTRLLRRSYGWIAIAFGATSQALGLLGLFSKVAFADVNPAVLALENLWLITVAVTLLINRPSPEPQSAIAQPRLSPTT